ncbi:fumarate lyase [Thiospirochaeta perfilievii]|uniref:Fumarate lyase n=2 Tax=Thiospirochaeta perfilievii TaxID=252967 RepID=A0A5C1QED6_9SPIO|nr:fumarate lyase [Thiospirochaeta perfilievii]
MNMNEVITFLVNKELGGDYVEYLEDINKFQSTNDTFNTAVTVVFLRHLESIEKMVIELQEILVEKETFYSSLLITGRTEMVSALPITLGQVFSSYAGAIERDRWRFNKIKERVRPSVLGGTAMGTCFGAPSKYLFSAEKHLRAITGLSLPRSQNLVSDISMCDKFVEAGAVYDVLSNTLFKMASDFTYYVSRGEFIHPNLQYGSTIMPIKTNPVLLEFVKGLAIDISLESRKIGEYSRNGQLQLNPFLPFILDAEISIFKSLIKAMDSLMLFIANLKVDKEVINNNLINSNAMVNSLRPYCDYTTLKNIGEILKDVKVKDIEELKVVIVNNCDLTMEFLDEYLKPGGFTSFLKENI